MAAGGGIRRLRARVHRPPADPGARAPYAGADSFVFLRLRVEHASGLTGNGFTGRFLAAEVAHFLNGALAEAALGCDPIADPELPARLMAQVNPRGMTGVVTSALSAFEIACWDLRGQAEGRPVCALLGGARADAPAHVTCGLPDLSEAALAETCAAEIAAGAQGVKILAAASGRGPAEDARRARAVRAAIGPEAELIVDANCGWTLAEARAFCEASADLGLAWLEEPLRGNEAGALTELAREGPHPIGAGQMEQHPDRFRQLRAAGLSVIQPNAVFAGGIGPALAVAQEMAGSGARIASAAGWDMVNLHWLVGGCGQGDVELHRAHDRITRLLTGAPTRMRAGRIAPPRGAGLGLDPDEAALAACAL